MIDSYVCNSSVYAGQALSYGDSFAGLLVAGIAPICVTIR